MMLVSGGFAMDYRRRRGLIHTRVDDPVDGRGMTAW
jgi:hypothetical protein